MNLANPVAASQATHSEIDPIRTFFSLEESDQAEAQGSGMSGKEKEKVRTCEHLNINSYYIETRDQIT